MDSSGNRNHAKDPIPSGPGLSGTGSSAYVNGYDYVEFDHSASFGEANEEYSMTMWVFMIQEPTTTSSKWCPIVHKGTWCSSAKRENFNRFHFFNLSLKIMTKTRTPMTKTRTPITNTRRKLNSRFALEHRYEGNQGISVYRDQHGVPKTSFHCTSRRCLGICCGSDNKCTCEYSSLVSYCCCASQG